MAKHDKDLNLGEAFWNSFGYKKEKERKEKEGKEKRRKVKDSINLNNIANLKTHKN